MRWNESIKELKQKVSETENIHFDNMDLILHGKRLENDEKWFQTEVFNHAESKDTSVQQRFKLWRTEETPVLQVVNR